MESEAAAGDERVVPDGSQWMDPLGAPLRDDRAPE